MAIQRGLEARDDSLMWRETPMDIVKLILTSKIRFVLCVRTTLSTVHHCKLLRLHQAFFLNMHMYSYDLDSKTQRRQRISEDVH